MATATMGRMARIKTSARYGHGLSRQKAGKNMNADMYDQAVAMSTMDAPTGMGLRAEQGAYQAGRVAGKAHNFAEAHPVMAALGAAGVLGGGTLLMLGGNETDAADSKINSAPRSPNHYTPEMLDGKLKQRTLQRLQDQIALNHIYTEALTGGQPIPTGPLY